MHISFTIVLNVQDIPEPLASASFRLGRTNNLEEKLNCCFENTFMCMFLMRALKLRR